MCMIIKFILPIDTTPTSLFLLLVVSDYISVSYIALL